MRLTNLIADNILQVYEGDNWTSVSITETLHDITIHEAVTQITASPNTIAAIVHHLKYWNGIMLQRMNGLSPEIPATNGFDVGILAGEREWQQLIEETHKSFITLANAVRNFPEERLQEATPNGKSNYYKNFQGIAEHAYYHLGQIVILKHIVKK